MTNKDKYRHLCKTELSIPLFSRDWWLDIVCGEDNWEVLLIEKDQHVIATIPLYKPLKDIVSMPPYTQTMGPWLAEEKKGPKYTTVLGRRQTLCKELIDLLEPCKSFLQNFNYAITDWLPFYWKGFKQTTRYTYILEDISSSNTTLENLSTNIQRNISKAKNKNGVTVRRGIAINDFLKVQQSTFERQGLSPKSQKVLVLLIEECKKRNQGELWGGYDSEGHLHAAVFVAWQESSAYYIAGGGDTKLRNSGAHSLVMWEAIQYVSTFTNRFDFEGSMIPGVERFFRGFGATQLPYFTITKGKLSLLDRIRIKLHV